MMTLHGGREGVVARLDSDTTRARADAFAALVDRSALDRAYRFATLILGDRVEAEDATHDAALAAWRHFDALRDTDRFEAWFGRILVNVCRDRLRARRRVTVRTIAADVSDEAVARRGPRAADPADAVARRQAMGQALATLDDAQREVIVLRFFLDLSIDQIAARLGSRPGTIKSRLHYAMRQLRTAYVGSEGPDGGPR
ncbi:MAG TPA: sigma-70 family RNA polymerase sigma factor [Candidatus Limnocylindrales bacterium]|nr:sigma-70 family RNA polymerase sigma factor [Candidatus Limnocylindrales bacterium]